jgi:hypothetical protein
MPTGIKITAFWNAKPYILVPVSEHGYVVAS